MNILRLLFTIYFAALSVMPCSDSKAQLKSEEINKTFNLTQDSHSKDEGDVCSPLCICNCCQITITSFKAEAILNFPKKVKSYYSKKILFQKNDFAYLVYDQIWQPPKI